VVQVDEGKAGTITSPAAIISGDHNQLSAELRSTVKKSSAIEPCRDESLSCSKYNPANEFIFITNETKRDELFPSGHINGSPVYLCKILQDDGRVGLGYGFLKRESLLGVGDEYACRIFVDRNTSSIVHENLWMLKRPPVGIRLEWVKYWPRDADKQFVFTELARDGLVLERAVSVEAGAFAGRCFSTWGNKRKSKDLKKSSMPGYLAIGGSQIVTWSVQKEEMESCSWKEILVCKS